jgi:hypothetical protein
MKLTRKQINNLLKVDFKGKSGKDNEISKALNYTRKSAAYYDAVDPKQKNKPFEFKKQAKDQWIDAVKLSLLTESQKDIDILFFNHHNGDLVSVYHTNYRNLIKEMGYDAKSLKKLKQVTSLPAFCDNHQMKAKLKANTIKRFNLVWEV